jgi:sugar lactone lactonase YvrE
MLSWPGMFMREALSDAVHAVCVQPNGVVLSPDGATAYVTDTGCLHPDTPDGGACSSANEPRSTYAFDVVKYGCVCPGTHRF